MEKFEFYARTEHSLYRIDERGAKKIRGNLTGVTNLPVGHLLEDPHLIKGRLVACFGGVPSDDEKTSPVVALIENQKTALACADLRNIPLIRARFAEETARVREKFGHLPIFQKFECRKPEQEPEEIIIDVPLLAT